MTYDADGVSAPDFAYGYTDALLDGVCRPVTFQTYDGDMEWVSDGRRRSADFTVGLPAAEAARRLRTALDPDGDWVAHVLRDAVLRLERLRAGDHPDAGGLVVAADKEHADALARRLEAVAGEPPEVVTSDAPDAGARIARFAAGTGSWLVSVLMVSEGVDIPRLRVGVYATSARTELFFRQVVGRFIRRTPRPRGQMSHLFMPADPTLRRLASQVEEERAMRWRSSRRASRSRSPPSGSAPSRATRSARSWSSAHGEAEMLQTTQPGDALQLFGAPAPSPALAAFTAAASGARAAGPSRPGAETGHERRERLRAERGALVSALARLTGEPHRAIHARVNRETGARSVTAASAAQLERGNALLEREAARRR